MIHHRRDSHQGKIEVRWDFEHIKDTPSSNGNEGFTSCTHLSKQNTIITHKRPFTPRNSRDIWNKWRLKLWSLIRQNIFVLMTTMIIMTPIVESIITSCQWWRHVKLESIVQIVIATGIDTIWMMMITVITFLLWRSRKLLFIIMDIVRLSITENRRQIQSQWQTIMSFKLDAVVSARNIRISRLGIDSHLLHQELISTLQWRHSGHDGVSNHQPHHFYSTVYSGADQRKHQSSASLAFVREFTGDRWIPRTNGQ